MCLFEQQALARNNFDLPTSGTAFERRATFAFKMVGRIGADPRGVPCLVTVYS